MANILFVVYLMGILVRFSTYVTSISDILKDRIELSTALTSWKRGLFKILYFIKIIC